MVYSHTYRERALEEYGDDCQLCDSTKDVEVHHIDGDEENNDLDNLLPVCISCHRRIHYDNGEYDDLYRQLPEQKQWNWGSQTQTQTQTGEAKSWTTISLSMTTKDRFDYEKSDGMSADAFVNVLLDNWVESIDSDVPDEPVPLLDAVGGDPVGDPISDELLNRLDRIEASAEAAEERTGRIERTLEEMGR